MLIQILNGEFLFLLLNAISSTWPLMHLSLLAMLEGIASTSNNKLAADELLSLSLENCEFFHKKEYKKPLSEKREYSFLRILQFHRYDIWLILREFSNIFAYF